MKKIIYAVLLLLGMSILSSCEKLKGGDEANIVGTWIVMSSVDNIDGGSADGSGWMEFHTGCEWSFSKDGTLNMMHTCNQSCICKYGSAGYLAQTLLYSISGEKIITGYGTEYSIVELSSSRLIIRYVVCEYGEVYYDYTITFDKK